MKLLLSIHYAYITIARLIKNLIDAILILWIKTVPTQEENVIYAQTEKDGNPCSSIMRTYYKRNEIHSINTLKKWFAHFNIDANTIKIIFVNEGELRIAIIDLQEKKEMLTGKRLSFNSVAIETLPSNPL